MNIVGHSTVYRLRWEMLVIGDMKTPGLYSITRSMFMGALFVIAYNA